MKAEARLASGRARWLVLLMRVILAAVFVWAAVPKLLDPAAFAEAVANYHLFPDALIGPLAVVVPALELVVAAALVAGIGARGAALAAALMLLAFTVGMIQAMARGIDLDCGCFGASTKVEVGWESIVRNLALLALAGCIVGLPDAKWRGGGPTASAAATAAFLLLAAAGLGACGGEADARPAGGGTRIESLGFVLDLPASAAISAKRSGATRVTLEPETRTPRTIELQTITSDAAERLLAEGSSGQARIAEGATALRYRVEGPTAVGSGGPEVHLTGVFRLCERAHRVECHAQGEPPPDATWCVAVLQTLRADCPQAPAP